MQVMLIIVGGMVGLWFAATGDAFFGFMAGAVLGYLLAQIRTLQEKVKKLSNKLEEAPVARPPAESAAAPEPDIPTLQPLAAIPSAHAPTAVVQRTVE